MKATLQRLPQKRPSIGLNRRGNVAIVFAVPLLPIIGAIGLTAKRAARRSRGTRVN